MPARRILVYGNSGSGKTTLARRLARELGIPHLDLDSVAWGETASRLPVAESLTRIQKFHRQNPSWVVEGCYGDLIEAALPLCTELRFLNPGIEACLENCRRRPWEPEKYASPAEQDARLEFLLNWVRQYATRDDEFGLARHQAIFAAFSGAKTEQVAVD